MRFLIKVVGYLLALGVLITTPELDLLGLFGIERNYGKLSLVLMALWILHFWFLRVIKEDDEIIL